MKQTNNVSDNNKASFATIRTTSHPIPRYILCSDTCNCTVKDSNVRLYVQKLGFCSNAAVLFNHCVGTKSDYVKKR